MRKATLFPLLALSLCLCLVGCTVARATGALAQEVLRPVKVYAMPVGEDPAKSATLIAGGNVKFIAYSASVDEKIWVEAPVTAGGPSVEVWSYHLKGGSSKAWEIVLSVEEDKEFLQIVEVSWERARLDLDKLPPLPAESEAAMLARSAAAPTPKVEVALAQDIE